MISKRSIKKLLVLLAVLVTVLMSIGFLMMSRVPVGRIILAGVWLFHIIYFCFGVKTLRPEAAENSSEEAA